jgi:hypothetical protein
MPMHAMASDAGKLFKPRQRGIDGTGLAEAFGKGRLDDLAGCFGHRS